MRPQEAGRCRCGQEITNAHRGGTLCRDCWGQQYLFEGWMLLVDAVLERATGHKSGDHPDFLWRDHYDAGEQAVEAAAMFLEENV